MSRDDNWGWTFRRAGNFYDPRNRSECGNAELTSMATRVWPVNWEWYAMTSISANLPPDKQREMLRRMLTIRRFEERASADYHAGKILRGRALLHR